MSMLRSEEMSLKKMRIPRDHAVEIMNEIGKIGDGVEFIDLNKKENLPEGKKNFYGMIKRCAESENRIKNLEKICDRFSSGKVPLGFVKFGSYVQFLNDLESEERLSKRINSTFFDQVENEIHEDEVKMIELTSSYDSINDNLVNLIEKKAVFDKNSQLILAGSAPEMRPSVGVDDEMSGAVGSGMFTLAGVIKAEDEMKMKRMIFRVSRGRATPTFFDLEMKDPTTKEIIYKRIFTIFFQGGGENILLQKLIKVCDIYNASRFNLPRREDIPKEISLLNSDITEKQNFLKQSQNLLIEFLRERCGNKDEGRAARYELFRQFLRKEEMIYSNLNKCRLTDNFIDGEVWIPSLNFPIVEAQIQKISSEDRLTANFVHIPVNDALSPPTYIKTNEFTWCFQEIINTYGTPRYGEINPALFAIVTFPFLFGVMFGDIGHGGLLLLFSLYLIFNADEIKKTDGILKVAVKARYLLMMMGFFAFFNGWMYNDFLSIPLNVFGSCYKNDIEVSQYYYIILIFLSLPRKKSQFFPKKVAYTLLD